MGRERGLLESNFGGKHVREFFIRCWMTCSSPTDKREGSRAALGNRNVLPGLHAAGWSLPHLQPPLCCREERGAEPQTRAVSPRTRPPAPGNPDTDQSLFSVFGSPPPPERDPGSTQAGDFPRGSQSPVSPHRSPASHRCALDTDTAGLVAAFVGLKEPGLDNRVVFGKRDSCQWQTSFPTDITLPVY